MGIGPASASLWGEMSVALTRLEGVRAAQPTASSSSDSGRLAEGRWSRWAASWFEWMVGVARRLSALQNDVPGVLGALGPGGGAARGVHDA